jgi:hypothetical protein
MLSTTGAVLIPCPLCDTLPYDDPADLADHLATNCPGRNPAVATAPHWTAVDTEPTYNRTNEPAAETADEIRSFSPGGTRATIAPRATAARNANPCSDKQQSFIRSLCDRTGTELPNFDTLDKRAASKLIDELKSAPAAPAAPAARPTARHGIELEHGRVYAAADGTFIKVTESKAGNLYGKLLDEDGKFTNYEKGLLSRIARHLTAEEAAAFGHLHKRCVFCSHNLSDEGDNRSVQVGYGETCAGNYGLPWG